MKRFLTALTLTVAASYVVVGYSPQSGGSLSSDPKTTPAYGVLVLRKASVEAELADLSGMFTSQHPSVESKRFELSVIGFEMSKVAAVEKSLVHKLSDTYGGLILRKVALEVELKDLHNGFRPQHPSVKKKQAELAALERELKDILQ